MYDIVLQHDLEYIWIDNQVTLKLSVQTYYVYMFMQSMGRVCKVIPKLDPRFRHCKLVKSASVQLHVFVVW